jgi:FtsH-binding integral membrane protein
MLGTLPAPVLLDIAILRTALSWGLGFFIADRKVYLFVSLAIGCFVCLFGYSVASVGAPPWAVVAAPVPLDILLLWYVMRKPRKMAVAYLSTWAIYIVLHILLSSILRYDSLIPAWRLHS